ncbi:MAG: tRNA pseudouridine(13) synthase TruD [Planctomycetes bacterium]|nr:tRNA pseudouridine(13) synthase TruD [Planctomycetota bacterium]
MRHLTAELPGTGGRLKATPEDFRVDEVPLWEPSGEGGHLLIRIRKRGMTTLEAVAQVARALELPEREVGYAGIKDARAVATQWLSLPLGRAERLAALRHPWLSIEERARHSHRLRPGDLAGNRFTIVLRGVDAEALPRAQAILAVLTRRGVPNWFGAQRFGAKGDSDRIGRAFVRGDLGDALQWFLGRPSPRENDPRVRAARQAFDDGDPARAAALFPPRLRLEAGVARAFAEQRDPLRAWLKVPRRLRLLFLSAWQSRLFNRCLEARFEALDRLLDGDVVVRHETDKAYPVLDPAQDQPRADRFELSPAGPLFGPGLMRTRGAAAALEEALFAAEGQALDHGKQPFRDLHLRGERRAYRFPLRGATVAEGASADASPEPAITLSFELPRGCYATSVVAEVTKSTASGEEEAGEPANAAEDDSATAETGAPDAG